jgi:hypothetical protein
MSAVSTDHGRRARRTIKAALVPAWIEFDGAAQVAQLRRTVTGRGKKTVEVVYLITSDRGTGPATLAAWVRSHWHIENKLHVLLGMEALARQPRSWRATGCTTETTRIVSHRSPARSPTGSTGFLATGTQELFDLLLDAQQNACGMCHEPFKEGQLIHVDHNHACCRGKNRSCGQCIRGLLCHTCNIALGYIGLLVAGSWRWV